MIFKVQNEKITISQTSQIVKHNVTIFNICEIVMITTQHFFQDYFTTLILIFASSTNQVFDSNDISFVVFQWRDILADILERMWLHHILDHLHEYQELLMCPREDNLTNDEIHQVHLHFLCQQEHPNHHQIYEPKKLELRQMWVVPNQLLLRIVILFRVHFVGWKINFPGYIYSLFLMPRSFY